MKYFGYNPKLEGYPNLFKKKEVRRDANLIRNKKMKIGMMCLWNVANGPSIHAELVGRAWVKLGHQLRIFSAQKHPDARPTFQKDEDFVIRHFRVDDVIPVTRATSFDPFPLLNEEYDVFIAQNVERLPAERLLEVFPKIKEKALTVQIVHEGKAPEDPLYYKFDWDIIVCFDQRYKDNLVKSFPAEKIHMIPYPYHPLKLGDKGEARKKLGLPPDDKIVFSFGFRPEDVVSVLPVLKDVVKEYPFRYMIIANPRSNLDELREAKKKYDFVDLQVKPLPLDELYNFLHASDALLIHRESSKKYRAVLSSSVCQVLGSGCPILFHESNYVELYEDVIIKYRDFEDMKVKLINLFQNKFDLKRIEDFLEDNKAERIAERFLQLFEELMKIRKEGRRR
ncbi:MAG: glycosyltransferase [Gemmatimonadetes bacterium]|nr:glycosyltransferase [Gemmatimonadota bacterium]